MKLHFRENLIYLRKKQGYSQIELANEIGITKGAVGSYEEGRAMPAAENLIKFACLFGVTLDAILQKNLSEGIELEDLSVEERLAKIEAWAIKLTIRLNQQVESEKEYDRNRKYVKN